jgi:hypothetical protein
MTYTEPLDRTHADCMRARSWIREMFQQAKDEVAAWEPRPCPPRNPLYLPLLRGEPPYLP